MSCPPSSSESCLLCLGQFMAYRLCLQCMRPTVGHDKQRSWGFKTARGDPDSFDLHSAKITMSASSDCRLDSCVLRLKVKSQLAGGVSRCLTIKYFDIANSCFVKSTSLIFEFDLALDFYLTSIAIQNQLLFLIFPPH